MRSFVAVLIVLAGSGAAGGSTLSTIRERGELRCGIGEGTTPGLNERSATTGEFQGFFPDVCRGLSRGLFDDALPAKLVPVPIRLAIEGLASGEIDVMVASLTGTLGRDGGTAARFVGTLIYDGQGFLARRPIGAPPPPADAPLKVCVSAGVSTPGNLADYIKATGKTWTALSFNTTGGRNEAFETGRCELLTSDRTTLYGLRKLMATPDHVLEVLPEVISREPLGPWVRNDDPQWFAILRWTIDALILAEAKGVTRANIDQQAGSTDAEARRLLGLDPGIGAPLGLDDRWAYRLLRETGNYGELWERNMGAASPIKAERGLNRLWSEGGLLYPLPFR
jgi:general L-amino acid transport system substrate-binding protein